MSKLITFERLEDMSPDGALRIHVAEDGDIIIAVAREHSHASVEFCGRISGGQSPRTHKALTDLAQAMKADNEDRVYNSRKGLRGEGVDSA
ncbi:MAG: hypothetical protein FD135_2361 [Comamonadaceae bacterium]|nr:MAG: hypothetical protein FD135_2361 [Comamonadaceae bacterium]